MMKLCVVWMELWQVVSLWASIPYKDGAESVISFCFLHSIMWHTLVWYIPYSALLWLHGSLFGGLWGARIFTYQLIFNSAIIHCWHTSDSLWLFKIFMRNKNIISVVKLAKHKIRGFCLYSARLWMQWWNFGTDCMMSSLSFASIFQNHSYKLQLAGWLSLLWYRT